MSEQGTQSPAQNQPHVEYRDIPGFPNYRVGSDGSVWSRKPKNGQGPPAAIWRRLSPGNCRNYHLHGLFREGKHYNRLAGPLVLLAFVGPCPPGMECCHGDGNRSNDNLSNLRWDTRKANHADAIRHGTHPRGSKHGNAKINEDIAALILRLKQTGLPQSIIARQLGLTECLVSKVVRRESWTHVAL